MALFVLISTAEERAPLDKAVPERFGNKAYRLPRGEWLVAFDGTSKQLSDELQITDGTLGVPTMVLNFTGYYGRVSKNIWEWVAVNADK
jgi:hypothetical protein